MCRYYRSRLLILLSIGLAACSDGPTGTSNDVASVTVEPGQATLIPEETHQLTATPRTADGDALSGWTPTWASSDESVATVSDGGLVMAVSPGTAKITATVEGRAGNATVTVAPPPGAPGRVVLPDGVPIVLDDLTVISAMSEVGVSADGTFAIETIGAAGSQVDVLGANGSLLLIGMVSADGAEIEVSATSTAQSLLFYALGIFALPADIQDEALDLIAGHPATATLAAVFEARMRANATALADEDPALEQAIEDARNGILASAAASQRPGLQTSTLLSAAAGLVNVLIEPTGTQQSGVELLNDPSGAGVSALNHFRRPAGLLVYETGYEQDDGTVVDVFPPALVGGPVDVPASSRLGVTSIGGVLTGSSPWAPEQSGPISLPMHQGAAKTFFEAVVLGPSADFTAPASILLDSRFFAYRTDWENIVDTKAEDLFWDVFAAPAFESLAFGGPAVITAAKRQAFVNQIRAAADPRLLNLGVMLRDYRGYARALNQMLDEIISNQPLRLDMINIAEDALDASNQQKAKYDKIEKRLSRRASAFAILAAVQLGLSTIDVVAAMKDLASSRAGESWRITATRPNVRLDPSFAKVTDAQRSVLFNASVDGFPNASFTFTWSTTGANGALHHELGQSGLTVGPITATGSDRIQYVATTPALPSGVIDHVTVEISLAADATGEDLLIGTATVPINGPVTEYTVSIAPGSASVLASQSVDLQAQLEPAYEGAGLFFRWNTTGNHGTIFPSPGELTGFDVVTYSANPGTQGQDQVMVEVFDAAGNPIGQASATVTVEPTDITTQGGLEIQTEPHTIAGGQTRYTTCAWLWFPITPGATRYEVRAHGFNDTWYYGTEINRTFTPPFPTFKKCIAGWGAAGSDGSRYWFFLSGSGGADAGAMEAFMQGRFAGMQVDVTVRF